MLKIENLSKKYTHEETSIKALSGISIDIEDGEFVVFVGPSGCGKTTLLNLIAGLEKPTEGRVAKEKDNSKIEKNDIGLVFQDFALFPWLTVYENIAFGLRLHHLREEKILEITNHYLKLTGLSLFKNKFPNTLSGGMKQRVAIARTLANDPKILLLDEPFGALDVQTRSQMQEFLARLWEEENKTMIMVTHDVDEAIYLADKVVVLSTKPGAIKEIIKIDLPRPRRSEIRFNEDFLKLKKRINYIIRSEHIKAALETGSLADNDFLKIGLNIWSGNMPFYLAKDYGLFTKSSLEAEIISLEKDENRIEQWKNDKVDALNVTLDMAIRLADRIPELKIFMVYTLSLEGDALITNHYLKSLTDLRGKKIGLEKDWVSHFFFSYLINKAGISSKELKILDLKGSDIGSAMISGKIDAGVLWEPWLSKAKELTNSNVLATAKDCPILYDVLIVKNKVLKEKGEELKKLEKIWKEAVSLFEKEKNESIKIISSYFGISEIELNDQLQQIKFLSSPPENLKKIMEETQEVLLKEGLIKKRRDMDRLLL